MIPFGVGVSPSTPWISGVIRHEQTGFLVDPAAGAIYGREGLPVGAVCADGYVRLGKRRASPAHQYAHRLIWEVGNGPIPAGFEIDHLNGNKADNRLANLDAVTKSQNALRAVALGLVPRGSQKPKSKLSEALVAELRRTSGMVSTAEWARRLGVDKTTVRDARLGRTWKHVPLRGRATPPRARPGSRRPRSRT